MVKQIWAQNEKDSANKERVEYEKKKADAEPKVKMRLCCVVLRDDFRDKTTQQSTTNDSWKNKVVSLFGDNDSAAFRDKARVAGRCVVSGGLCVLPLTTRNLALG